MAQIGTIQVDTQNSGTVDVPVFETGDSSSDIYEFVRVETASGTGFIPVTDTGNAAYPYLRVQSQNHGIVAITDTKGSTIPDSVVQQNFATNQSYNNGETVSQFVADVGSPDLTAVDNPEFNDTALNNGPAVVIDDGSSDGTEDGFDYNLSTARTEPITIIWAFEVTDTVSMGAFYRETIDERAFYRNDNDEWQLIMNGNSDSGGSFSLGDKIVTLAVDESTAVLRANGVEVASVTSTADITVQDSGSFWYDDADSGRVIPSNAGGVVVHNERLSGSALTNEESRIESEFNMSVL